MHIPHLKQQTDTLLQDIPDSTFPVLRPCLDSARFTATDLPVALQISKEGNFLVVKNDGKFVGKAAIPYKKCSDPSKGRQWINAVAAEADGLIKIESQLCQ